MIDQLNQDYKTEIRLPVKLFLEKIKMVDVYEDLIEWGFTSQSRMISMISRCHPL